MMGSDHMRVVACTRTLQPTVLRDALERRIQIHHHAFVVPQPAIGDEVELPEALAERSLVFTSIHAVNATTHSTRFKELAGNKVSCYCINGRTADAARQARYDVIGVAPNALELASKLVQHKESRPIHFTTANNRMELHDTLLANDIQLERFNCYTVTADPITMPDHEAILFFSPSQVDAFLTVNELRADIPVFCIGTTTAAHCMHLGYTKVRHAPEPKESTLIQALFQHYEKT